MERWSNIQHSFADEAYLINISSAVMTTASYAKEKPKGRTRSALTLENS